MGKLTLEQAAAWCGGKIDPKYRDVTFFGANNDTRKLAPGELFVALEGARDGHAFMGAAMEQGAAAVLCRHCDGDYPAIVVEDPRTALADIARQERRRLNMKVVGVTGSVGKSTTKEMIATVLEGTYRTGKSPANHNNDLGLPMSILALPEDTEVAVLEMGMNHFREMAYLSSVAQPDLAVIVNIGTMHMENLGSREGIRQAKLEILEGMTENGTLILNGDDDLLRELPGGVPQRRMYFGQENTNAQVQGDQVVQEDGFLGFRVKNGTLAFPVELALDGLHLIPDALAAVTVGLELGVEPGEIQERLSQFRNMAGRQEIFEAKGCTIISDCYNAGPESMAAALNVLGAKPGRKIAVLGDMLELGVCTQAEHYRVGRIAAEKADILLAYGPNSGRMVTGAITGGMPAKLALSFDNRETLGRELLWRAEPGDVILFKGSHGMHLELVLEKFLQDET